VLHDHPADIDARIGLGMVITRNGAWRGAWAILTDAERDSAQNADLFGALARAYRRTGDDRRALEYFRRARALSPGDPDIAARYEAGVLAHRRSLAGAGFQKWGPADVDTSSGSFTTSLRVAPRLHL